MTMLRRRASEFLRSEEGPTATEYAAMLGLIILALIPAFGPLKAGWVRLYTTIGAAVTP